jgi:cell division protein FtsW (lipid II flippase)
MKRIYLKYRVHFLPIFALACLEFILILNFSVYFSIDAFDNMMANKKNFEVFVRYGIYNVCLFFGYVYIVALCHYLEFMKAVLACFYLLVMNLLLALMFGLFFVNGGLFAMFNL